MYLSKPELAKKHLGYYRVAVSQFIPNPVRYYNCQKFGHTKFNCRRNEVCTKCEQEDHADSQECKNEAKCINCQGSHSSNDKECPKWKEGNSNNKGRKRDFIHRSQKNKWIYSAKTTYAQASAATKPVVKTVTVETQTEMTRLDGSKQPKK